jgi:hypothetical protein
MLVHRKRLPDTAFVAAPSFLVSSRRRAEYDASAIRLASKLH